MEQERIGRTQCARRVGGMDAPESKPCAWFDEGEQETGSLLCPELPLACMIYKYHRLVRNTG